MQDGCYLNGPCSKSDLLREFGKSMDGFQCKLTLP
jgi:hypothetical protein